MDAMSEALFQPDADFLRDTGFDMYFVYFVLSDY